MFKIVILNIILAFLVTNVSARSSQIPDGLTLRGTGEVRYLGLIKVYDAHLYLAESTPPDQVLQPNSPKCLLLSYEVDLSVENFIKAADKVLSKQHDPPQLARIQDQLDQLNRSYRDVREKDQYLLCYDDDSKQTSLTLNGELLTTLTSELFAEIYFGIWLGANMPIDLDLRNDLLAEN
jgi:hypothetical protein